MRNCLRGFQLLKILAPWIFYSTQFGVTTSLTPAERNWQKPTQGLVTWWRSSRSKCWKPKEPFSSGQTSSPSSLSLLWKLSMVSLCSMRDKCLCTYRIVENINCHINCGNIVLYSYYISLTAEVVPSYILLCMYNLSLLYLHIQIIT